jgi:hypothetical protein
MVGEKLCPTTPWAKEVEGIIAAAMLNIKPNARHNRNIIDPSLQIFIEEVLRIKKENHIATG